MIFNYYNIKISIINIKMKIFFRFLNEKNKKRDLRMIDFNKIFNKIFIEIFTKFLHFITIYII